jgi:POT family proton-dependent oligopeptide transporter
MGKGLSALGLPKEVKALFWVKIFTTFSFAVLYSSLVLYLTKDVGEPKLTATGVVGVFIALNFLLHFFGGYAGGKIISNRMLLLVGMLMEFFGLILLPHFTYIGIGVFLTGSGLYATSINAIMIQRFEPGDPKLELASFWIYSGMNIGFLLGNTLSGYFHLNGVYTSLFYLSATVSALTILLISLNWKLFNDVSTDLHRCKSLKEKQKRFMIAIALLPIFISVVIVSLRYHQATSGFVMAIGAIIFLISMFFVSQEKSKSDKNKGLAFIILVIAALGFWSLFFISPMGLTLFIDQFVSKTFWGYQFAPQWFNNINTVIVVVGGPILGGWFKKKREAGMNLSTPLLFASALLCIGSAFAILPLGIRFFMNGHLLPVIWVVLSYFLLTIGELLISPVGVAMIGKLAPEGRQGLFLGIWSMVSGIASMCSKYFSQLMVIPRGGQIGSITANSFSGVFNFVGWGGVLLGLLLLMMTPLINRLITGDKAMRKAYDIPSRA